MTSLSHSLTEDDPHSFHILNKSLFREAGVMSTMLTDSDSSDHCSHSK